MAGYENPALGFGDTGATSPLTLSAASNQLSMGAPDLSASAGAAVPDVSVSTPDVAGASGPGMFQEGGAFQVGLGAIKTLGSLWNSFQQTKLAKKSLNLQTKAYETNLANQTQTYNTALEDRINARYAAERRDPAEAQSYIEKNKL